MKRVILVYHDGTCETLDVRPNADIRYEKVQRADMLVEIHLETGETFVIKNRWGDRGKVTSEN